MFPYIMYIEIKDALFVAGKGNREGELMNKTKIIFFLQKNKKITFFMRPIEIKYVI